MIVAQERAIEKAGSVSGEARLAGRRAIANRCQRPTRNAYFPQPDKEAEQRSGEARLAGRRAIANRCQRPTRNVYLPQPDKEAEQRKRLGLFKHESEKLLAALFGARRTDRSFDFFHLFGRG